MNLLSHLLGLSLLFILGVQAQAFQKRTVCRQALWKEALELKTRALLTAGQGPEMRSLLRCRYLLQRKGNEVSWRGIGITGTKHFELPLKGKL